MLVALCPEYHKHILIYFDTSFHKNGARKPQEFQKKDMLDLWQKDL